MRLAVWDRNGAPDRRVTYSAAAKTLALEGKCLDAYNDQTAAGTPVEIYDCDGGTNQQWTLG